jgi:hypothetical protein
MKSFMPLILVGEISASQLLDVNLLLNILTILIACAVAVPIMKSRRKDETIKDLNASLAAADRRLEDAQAEVAGAQVRANQMEEACKYAVKEQEKWHARYEEQRKYTAQGAVTHMEELLIDHRDQVAERHEHMITALDKLTDILTKEKEM